MTIKNPWFRIYDAIKGWTKIDTIYVDIVNTSSISPIEPAINTLHTNEKLDTLTISFWESEATKELANTSYNKKWICEYSDGYAKHIATLFVVNIVKNYDKVKKNTNIYISFGLDITVPEEIVSSGGGEYVLPPASLTELGGIKINKNFYLEESSNYLGLNCFTTSSNINKQTPHLEESTGCIVLGNEASVVSSNSSLLLGSISSILTSENSNVFGSNIKNITSSNSSLVGSLINNTSSANSNLFGRGLDNTNSSNSNIIGTSSIGENSYYANMIGYSNKATNSPSSNGIGYAVYNIDSESSTGIGYDITNNVCSNSIGIGQSINNFGSSNVVGIGTTISISSAPSSLVIGNGVGSNGGSNNIVIGNGTAIDTTGNSTAIGNNVNLTFNSESSIAIGNNLAVTGSHKAIIIGNTTEENLDITACEGSIFLNCSGTYADKTSNLYAFNHLLLSKSTGKIPHDRIQKSTGIDRQILSLPVAPGILTITNNIGEPQYIYCIELNSNSINTWYCSSSADGTADDTRFYKSAVNNQMTSLDIVLPGQILYIKHTEGTSAMKVVVESQKWA